MAPNRRHIVLHLLRNLFTAVKPEGSTAAERIGGVRIASVPEGPMQQEAWVESGRNHILRNGKFLAIDAIEHESHGIGVVLRLPHVRELMNHRICVARTAKVHNLNGGSAGISQPRHKSVEKPGGDWAIVNAGMVRNINGSEIDALSEYASDLGRIESAANERTERDRGKD